MHRSDRLIKVERFESHMHENWTKGDREIRIDELCLHTRQKVGRALGQLCLILRSGIPEQLASCLFSLKVLLLLQLYSFLMNPPQKYCEAYS